MSYSFRSFARTGEHIMGHDECDVDGNPAGGYAADGNMSDGYRMHIHWQNGPVNREAGEKPNGAFVEDVLEVCKRRLEFYQQSRFSSADNAEAIEHIETAIRALDRRRQDREERGVQGKHEV